MSLLPKLPLFATTFVTLGLGLVPAHPAHAQHYQQTNLVSDQAGATTMDPNLVNPWGLSRSSTSPWWVSNNGTGTSTLYNGAGTAQALIVTIPPAPGGTGPGVPTGTVFNGTTTFELTTGNPARFLFVTEDGTIAGWNPAVDATNAVTKFVDSKAVFKGMALASNRGKWFLFAANFKRRRLDVFNDAFARVRLTANAFVDPQLPRNYAPFNVQNIGGDLYVSYAKTMAGSDDEVAGAGNGYVDIFTVDGRLLRRLQHGAWLNAPWAMVMAPGDFGAFSHRLLVGQFGSGEIVAFDVATGGFAGKMHNAADSSILTIDGLWGLSFGGGGNSGSATTLYFSAGIEDEAHGLLGTLTPIATEQLLGNGL